MSYYKPVPVRGGLSSNIYKLSLLRICITFYTSGEAILKIEIHIDDRIIGIFQKFFSHPGRLLFFLLIITASVAVSSHSTLPNIFHEGDIISAGEVNENFSILDTRLKGLEGRGTVPSGTVVLFAGQEAPEGWLFCNGKNLSRKEYSRLYKVIGETYGPGDGLTTFTLPRIREVHFDREENRGPHPVKERYLIKE